jgi:hypothetical protein
MQVVDAIYRLSLLFGFGQCRQQLCRQNSDNGDYHEKFDQGESCRGRPTARILSHTLHFETLAKQLAFVPDPCEKYPTWHWLGSSVGRAED